MSGYTNKQIKELEGIFDSFFKVINKDAEIKISEMDESPQKITSIIDDVIKFIKVYDEKNI